MGISRKASAHWEGDLKSGKGKLGTPQSGLLADTPYGFNSRFGDAKGTNPEELIAAAHAGCFTMAFLGSVRIISNSSSESASRVLTTGSRPMNSGINPNESKSSGSTE